MWNCVQLVLRDFVNFWLLGMCKKRILKIWLNSWIFTHFKMASHEFLICGSSSSSSSSSSSGFSWTVSEKLFVYILSWYKIAYNVLLEYRQSFFITRYVCYYTLPPAECLLLDFRLPVFVVSLRLQTKNTHASSHAGSTTPLGQWTQPQRMASL